MSSAVHVETSRLVPLVRIDKTPSVRPARHGTRSLGNAEKYFQQYQQKEIASRPGSIYKGDLSRSRPLGLLPNRKKDNNTAWKELSLLQYSTPSLEPQLKADNNNMIRNSSNEQPHTPVPNSVISAKVNFIPAQSNHFKPLKPYSEASMAINNDLDDEYLSTLAQIDLHHYKDKQEQELEGLPPLTNIFFPAHDKPLPYQNHRMQKSANKIIKYTYIYYYLFTCPHD